MLHLKALRNQNELQLMWAEDIVSSAVKEHEKAVLLMERQQELESLEQMGNIIYNNIII